MDFKKIITVAAIMLLASSVQAKASTYEKILKQWTRHEQIFTWDNFEVRMIWNVTYLSDEFRAAQREKMAALYEWTDSELAQHAREDGDESRRSDVFVAAIYAGSSEWPEIGKDDAKWRLLLETDDGKVIESGKFERIPVTELERTLYPYLDKWSNLYRVSFPKSIHSKSLHLRMTGLPAHSELVWNQ